MLQVPFQRLGGEPPQIHGPAARPRLRRKGMQRLAEDAARKRQRLRREHGQRLRLLPVLHTRNPSSAEMS